MLGVWFHSNTFISDTLKFKMLPCNSLHTINRCTGKKFGGYVAIGINRKRQLNKTPVKFPLHCKQLTLYPSFPLFFRKKYICISQQVFLAIVQTLFFITSYTFLSGFPYKREGQYPLQIPGQL